MCLYLGLVLARRQKRRTPNAAINSAIGKLYDPANQFFMPPCLGGIPFPPGNEFLEQGRSDASLSHSRFSKYPTWPFEKKKHSYIDVAPFSIDASLASPLIVKCARLAREVVHRFAPSCSMRCSSVMALASSSAA